VADLGVSLSSDESLIASRNKISFCFGFLPEYFLDVQFSDHQPLGTPLLLAAGPHWRTSRRFPSPLSRPLIHVNPLTNPWAALAAVSVSAYAQIRSRCVVGICISANVAYDSRPTFRPNRSFINNTPYPSHTESFVQWRSHSVSGTWGLPYTEIFTTDDDRWPNFKSLQINCQVIFQQKK